MYYNPSNFDLSGNLPRCLKNKDNSISIQPFTAIKDLQSLNFVAFLNISDSDGLITILQQDSAGQSSSDVQNVRAYLDQFIKS